MVIRASPKFGVARAGYAFAGPEPTQCNVPTRSGVAAFVVTDRLTGNSVIGQSRGRLQWLDVSDDGCARQRLP